MIIKLVLFYISYSLLFWEFMSDFKMKIETNSAEKENENGVKDAKDVDKVIKSEEKAPKSPEISFEVGDYCLVKRPADNNWRKFMKFPLLFLLLRIYLYRLLIDVQVFV